MAKPDKQTTKIDYKEISQKKENRWVGKNKAECLDCTKRKPLNNFGKRKSGYPSSYCSICLRIRRKALREEPRWKEYMAAVRERNHKLVLAYLLRHPCQHCSNTNPVCLEFDHIAKKNYSIAKLYASTNPKIILSEISLCAVLYANCHRIKTLKEAACWRLKYT